MNFDSFGYNGGNNDYSYGSGGGNQDFSYGQTGGFGGNAGGGGGGGWMNSGDDDSKVRGGYKNQTLRPVTIKQLTDVPFSNSDMPVHIDGEEIKQVKFVGVVRNIVQQSIHVTYSVEDGTGKIDVRMWVNGEPDDSARDQIVDPNIAVGKYVRVYGELKFFNNTRSINAHKIRAVTDHNEVTCHGLEAIYAHLCKTRGPKPAAAAVSGPYSANMGRVGMDDGMTPVRAAILDVIKSAPPTPEGVSITTIQQNLAGRFQSDEVTSAADWLINEGHLFTTVDEQHLQTTSAFS
ncbi:Replication factor A protein 2 [Coemansia erecta]|nr:Replication factor A protein 2 [Coemansia sp. RSA 2618]KAJ2824249.1 Replication factor A protein 2 [Coemansia erecta]